MGIDLVIEDENGDRIADLPDSKNRFAAALRSIATSETHCVQYIAPFTDTTFNQVQIPRLIQELENLRLSLSDSGQSASVAEVVEFIRTHSQTSHTFAKFYGD